MVNDWNMPPEIEWAPGSNQVQERTQEALRSIEGRKMTSWISKDPEGDVWSQESLVFPEWSKREDFFTEANMYKLFGVDKAEYPHCDITFEHSIVYVKIYALDDEDPEIEDVYTESEFVKMGWALVFG